jgi:hypothetical protein
MAPRKMGQWTGIFLAVLLTPAFATTGKHSPFFPTCSSNHHSLILFPEIPSGLTVNRPNYTQSPDAPDAPQAFLTERGSPPVNNQTETVHQTLVPNDEEHSGSRLSTPQNLLPDTPPHSALSSRDKLDFLPGVIFDAGWAQLVNDWPGYGRGMEGFGKRLGALMADRAAGNFLGSFLLPTLLHQDPRYFRLGAGLPLLHRLGYALSRVVITRKDNGGNTFNSSLVLSTLLVKSLTNAYYPQQERGFSPMMNRVGGSLLGSAQSFALVEFLPDIVGTLRKYAPARLKGLERKLPFREHWNPDVHHELNCKSCANWEAPGHW